MQSHHGFAVVSNFTLQMIPILIGQKDFGKAEVMSKRCAQMVTKGPYNYHASLIYLALVGFSRL